MGRIRVGPATIREYVGRMRERYEQAAPRAKGPLLDEVCEMTGYHRKAVIRLLPVARLGRGNVGAAGHGCSTGPRWWPCCAPSGRPPVIRGRCG